MSGLFLKLLDMSISASWVILAVIVARRLLRKAPKALRCALWALVALRLLCPFSLESTLSLIPETEPVLSSISTAKQETSEPNRMTVNTAGTYSWQSESPPQSPSAPSTTMPPAVAASPSGDTDWLTIGTIVWGTGLVVMAEYAFISYHRVRRKVEASIYINNGVYLCDYIDSPFILGLVKPKIYLPTAVDPGDAAYVLAHERAHLKRKDHWWKPIGYALLAVYWFNPLMWVAYVLLCRDIELACDERVIKAMDVPEKKAYSEALLNCSIPRHMIAACPLAFGEVGVKDRVKSVLSYKKPGFWILLASVLALIVVAVCFLTDPKQDTLSGLYPGKPSDVNTFQLTKEGVLVQLRDPDDLAAVWEMLEEAEYDPEPFHSGEGEYPVTQGDDRYWTMDFISTKQSLSLYFSTDFTVVCTEDADGILFQYHVENPETLEAFYETYVDLVDGETVTAQPFATRDEPWKWMQKVSLDAIYQSTCTTQNQSYTGGSMYTHQMQELLDILNTIPADALYTHEELDGSFWESQPDLSGLTNITVYIADTANDLGIFIRYYEDTAVHLEFYMTGDAGWMYDYDGTMPHSLQKWQVQDDALLAFMKELAAYPPCEYGTEHTLSRLCTADRKDVTCVDLLNDKGMTCLNSPSELSAFWELLDKIPYDPKPHTSGTDLEIVDENGNALHELEFNMGEETQMLYFYRDYSSVCVEDENGVWNHYQVKNVLALEEFYTSRISLLSWQEVTAHPFATVDQPYQWMQKVTAEALQEADLHYATSPNTFKGGNMSPPRAEAFLNILKTIPEDALSGPEILEDIWNGEFCYVATSEPNMVVTLQDAVNNLGVSIRYYESEETPHLELFMVEGRERVVSHYNKKISSAMKWEIQSDELLACMRELIDHRPSVMTWVGAEYEWLDEPLEVCGGGASISLRMIEGWQTEIVEYTEGCESFGIRVRPAGVMDGWVYFSFWPEGYFPEEVNRYYAEQLLWNFYGYTSYPMTWSWYYGTGFGPAIWTYQRFPSDIGDYAFINEGADSWLLEYEEAIGCIVTLLTLEGGTQENFSIPEATIVPVDYPQSNSEQHGFKLFEFETADKANLAVNSAWIYDETIQEHADHTHYGAFWPEYVTEGRISIEYWEGGFQPGEDVSVEETAKKYYGFLDNSYTGTLPGEDRFTYLWINRDYGSYVFRFENTQNWTDFQIECAVEYVIKEISFR